MNDIERFLPESPDWILDWTGITDAFPWIRKLIGSTQDAMHHAEGDVYTHVGMVVSELVSSLEWRSLPVSERLETFAAALLHDVCKPETRKEEDGRITNKGHSKMGAIEARKILWRMGFNFASRERVCQMIRVHQVPFWLIEKPQWEADRFVVDTSLTVSNLLLAILAEADAKGRVCADQNAMIDSVLLFREIADERGCLNTPFIFPNSHTKIQYFHYPESKKPDIELFDTTDAGFVMTMMSGLPAMGKSYRRKSLGMPVVSFDDMALELDTDNMGHIVQAVRERAKVFLRRKESFIWDSTNLSKQLRELPIQLGIDYGARIRIMYVESCEAEMRSRNQARTDDRVPDAVIAKMMNRWEVPTLSEAHEVVYIAS